MSSGVFGCARPAPKPHRAAAAAAALSVLLWLPTRMANRHVMQYDFNRLAHRLDASEAALEEERHDQVVVQRSSPVRVPRAAAAAPRQRGAAANERSTEEAARSAPVGIATPLTHLRR